MKRIDHETIEASAALLPAIEKIKRDIEAARLGLRDAETDVALRKSNLDALEALLADVRSLH